MLEILMIVAIFIFNKYFIFVNIQFFSRILLSFLIPLIRQDSLWHESRLFKRPHEHSRIECVDDFLEKLSDLGIFVTVFCQSVTNGIRAVPFW